jgi:DNA invertase Pin-like site-specific DNA recombinase
MSDNNKALGLIRVSRMSRKKDSAHSPEVQRRLIEPFAGRQAWDLAELLNENEMRGGDVSGGQDPRQRPGFGPAISRVESGEVKIIVAADLSRLFRDLDEQRRTIDAIEAVGGEFWTVADGRVTHETAQQELTANLNGSINHYQKRYAKEKSWLAVEVAIEQGKVPWSQTAPGYVRDDDSRLTPDREVVPAIVGAFELRDSGATVQAVQRYLAEHGIVRSFHGTGYLLRDRIYLGEIHFGTHTPNLQAHDAIIDRDLFDRVQARIVPRGRRSQSERLLARLGVLLCASCHARMVVGTQKQNGRSYPFYRCPGTSECDHHPTISAVMAEDLVVEAVKRELADVEGRASVDTARRDAEALLADAQAALDGALSALMASGLESEPVAVQRLSELRAKRDEAQDSLQRFGPSEPVTVTAGDWDNLTLAERRALIPTAIRRATVAPGGRGADRIRIEAFSE